MDVVTRIRATPVLLSLSFGAAVTLAGCGSTSPSVAANTPPVSTTTSSPAVTGPPLVGASAVPAVSGALGSKPTVAKPTGAPPTTLLVHDVATGSGAVAADGDQLTVQYVGDLYATGKQFDASWDRNQTFPFTLGQQMVITGWDEGLVGMKVGGRRELVIPPALGYGPAANGPIPASSTLVFVVDLVAVTPAP